MYYCLLIGFDRDYSLINFVLEIKSKLDINIPILGTDDSSMKFRSIHTSLLNLTS